jgi:hypothetical protein
MSELTPAEEAWFELEKRLIESDPYKASALHKIISARRMFAKVTKDLLAARYSDGEVDGATLSHFANRIEEIDELIREEEGS